MSPPWRTILLCSCDDTMSPDAERVARVCRGAKIDTAHQLCRAELDKFRAAVEIAEAAGFGRGRDPSGFWRC